MERKELNEENGLKAKKNWNLKTDESYEDLREKFQKNQSKVAWCFISWACCVGISVPFLLWFIPSNKLPSQMQPFWNVYGISVFLMLPMLLLRFTSLGREAESYQGIGRAINSFECAKMIYYKWKKDNNDKNLKRCYKYLKYSEEYLRDVPMFKKIYEDVEAKYKDFFEGESN